MVPESESESEPDSDVQVQPEIEFGAEQGTKDRLVVPGSVFS